jgi:hypothetical protein
MKRAWLLLALISLVTVPDLCLAGTRPTIYPAEKIDESELARNTGQGNPFKVSSIKQTDKIVIWDEWARNASSGAGASNASHLGVGTVNYSQRQATFTATK